MMKVNVKEQFHRKVALAKIAGATDTTLREFAETAVEIAKENTRIFSAEATGNLRDSIDYEAGRGGGDDSAAGAGAGVA